MEVCVQLFVDTLDRLVVTRCGFDWTCGLGLYTVIMPRRNYRTRPTYLALTERFAADGIVFQDILDLVFANKGVTKER
jgi:hypothetical protein